MAPAPLLFLATSALAADLQLPPAPPLPPPVEGATWAGVYAGFNAGGVWSNSKAMQRRAPDPTRLSRTIPG